MANCCGGGSACGCKISPGTGISVSGSGTPTDPFVVSANIGLTVQDSTDFNFTLGGAGTVASPWVISLAYASTAKLDNIPDVNASGPSNGQVLSWQSATQTWVPANPTTAASGSVQHNTSLTGDGSVGTPLAVVTDSTRLVGNTAAGVGLTDTGMNAVVRHFTDAVARAAAVPAPTVNALSALDSNPGVVEYWDGTQWTQIKGRADTVVTGGQFLQLSGPYAGSRLTHVLKQVTTNSDGSGSIDVLDATDLAGYSGVLTCVFQETGTTPFQAVLYPNVTKVSGLCYFTSDGTLFTGLPVTGMVDAWVYA